MQEMFQKSNIEVVKTFFCKISTKSTNFKVSSLSLEFQVLRLGLTYNFWWSLGLEVSTKPGN